MTKERVLILGCSGMLGHKLLGYFAAIPNFEVFGTVRHDSQLNGLKTLVGPRAKIFSQIDSNKIETVEAAIRESQATQIINCIGIIKQLPQAKDPVVSIAINSLFPHQVAQLAKTHNARLIHFSTDCVYSGLSGNYSEDDPTDAQDLYGRSKVLGEVSGPGCLTIRSSIVGPEIQSKNGLIEWFLSSRGSVKGYAKALYTGHTTLQMAKVVHLLIDQFPHMHGIWNVAAEAISKFEILSIVNRVANLGIQIIPDESVVIDRRLNGERFQKATGYKSPSWEAMLTEMIRDKEHRLATFSQFRSEEANGNPP